MVLAAKPVQHRNRIAHPQDQGGTQRAERGPQIGQRLGGEGPLAGGCVGQLPIVRFHDVKRQHRPQFGRAGEGGVVVDAQIAFEPDENIHGTFI